MARDIDLDLAYPRSSRATSEAFKWYSIAAELGVANAARYWERVARELDASARLQVGELAQAWLKAFRQKSPRGH